MFNIFCDKFEQSEADRRVFRKFDDGEVEMVVFMHVDDTLAHAQATMERLAAKLGKKFLSEADGGEVGHRDDKQDTSFSGGINPLSKWMSRKLRRRRKMC